MKERSLKSIMEHEEAPLAPLRERTGKGDDLLMWLGYTSYPDETSWRTEASRIGVSRRIAQIPEKFAPGRTRLYLAHDFGVKGMGRIIAYCTVDFVEVVAERREVIGHPWWMQRVDPRNIWASDPRGGQMMTTGGIYLRSDRVIHITHRSIEGICKGRFRSYKWVDRRQIMDQPFALHEPWSNREGLPPLTRKWDAWDPQELEWLLKAGRELGPYQACKRHAITHHRTFEACMYQWKRHGLVPSEPVAIA